MGKCAACGRRKETTGKRWPEEKGWLGCFGEDPETRNRPRFGSSRNPTNNAMRCEGERSICPPRPGHHLVLWLCPGGEGRRSGWEWDGITSPRPLYRRPATRPVRACHRDETMQWLYHLQRIFIQFSKARSGHHGHSNCPRKANCRRAIAV